MKHRVGIFSGTFDPIHEGHIALAQTALQKARLDKVILLVEKKPRHKKPEATFLQRQKMCQLVAAQNNWLEVLELKDLHFDVRQTLPQLQKRFPKAELVMILGSDVFARLPTWPGLDSLVESVRFVVALRDSDSPKVVEDAALDSGAELMLVKNHFPKMSSTQIREQLQLADLKHIDPKVAGYIADNKLYVGRSSDKA